MKDDHRKILDEMEKKWSKFVEDSKVPGGPGSNHQAFEREKKSLPPVGVGGVPEESMWIEIQEYLTKRNEQYDKEIAGEVIENCIHKNIAFEYSYKNALTKAKKSATYFDEDGEVKLNVTTLAKTPDEAYGSTRAANDSRRIKLPIEEDYEVTVTHIGTNPYTHRIMQPKPRKINYEVARVDGIVDFEIKDKLRTFYAEFDMHKHNYVGVVNKKSDGRCPRTGDIGDPKSSEYMQKWRHQPSIVLTPNVKIRETTRTVKYANQGELAQEREIAVVERGNDCECGCNIKLKDLRRGEVLCPKCGIVHARASVG